MSAASAKAAAAATAPPFGDPEEKTLGEKALLAEFKATLDKFPREMKPEYAEAMMLCPSLVESEADPLAFLRREDFNVLASVLRFIMYWKVRKQVFGDRFSCPMNLSPDGVLKKEERDLFSTGYLTLLPPDGEGSPVLFFDLGRHASDVAIPPLETRVRLRFYLSQVAGANPVAQREGVVCIFVMDEQLLPELECLCKEPLAVINKALPIKVKRLYFIPGYGCDDDSLRSLKVNLPRAVKKTSFEEEAIPVFGDDLRQLALELESFGFSSDSLPAAIGGKWGCDRFSDWLVSQGHKNGRKPLADLTATAFATSKLNAPSTLREMLSEALEHIPHDEVVDYVEAKKRVPVLVEHESPFSRFLACENNSAVAAARRLAAYWRERRACYGDRAFLPLNLSGQGALTQEDLGLLVSGSILLLPEDRIGRPVICLDMTRQDPRQDLASAALRIWFYSLHVASEDPKAQSEGIVCLFILFESNQASINASTGGDKFFSALPVRLTRVHVLFLDGSTSWTGKLQSSMPSKLPFIGEVQTDRISVHAASAGHNILARLNECGLKRAGLPLKIGGTWNQHTDLRSWISERSGLENEALIKLVTKHSEDVYGVDEPDGSEDPDATVGGLSENKSPEEQLPWIFNGLDGFQETNEILAKGLAELEDAISMLPCDDKAALLEAREMIPELAEKEAPPLRFLRFENYNAWSAAQRLATYWKSRKEVFTDRAFLPMNLSGEGTLTREDVTVLGCGYLALLPYDKHGRSVVCFDDGRAVDRSDEMRTRLAFYTWSVISENLMSQQDGLKLLMMQASSKSGSLSQKAKDTVMQAFPARFASVHIVNAPNESERRTFLDSLVPRVMGFLGFLSKTATAHAATTKEELIANLLEHDFLKEGLPEELGGTWSYDMFSHWLELRTRYEWDLPVAGVKDPLMPHVPDYHAKPRSQLTEAEKVERKRRLNVLNSRRKRERVKVEVEVFSAQVEQLQERNRELKIESNRLEECLAAARAEVAKAEMARRPQAPPFVGTDLLSHSNQLHSQPVALPFSLSQLQGAIDPRVLEEMALRQQVIAGGMSPELLSRLDHLPIVQQHMFGSAVSGQTLAGAGIGQRPSFPRASSGDAAVQPQTMYPSRGQKRKPVDR